MNSQEKNSYLNLRLSEILIGNMALIADRKLMLVDNQSNVTIEIGECHNRKYESEHEDDNSIQLADPGRRFRFQGCLITIILIETGSGTCVGVVGIIQMDGGR